MGEETAKAKEGNAVLLVKIGDIANLAIAILSTALLVMTLQFIEAPFNCEMPDEIQCVIDEKVDLSGSIFDECYLCDGFCVSNHTNPTWNSHMLSLYADAIMTIPLLWLWFARSEDLERLGLADHFLSFAKLGTVLFHGGCHWFVSGLTHGFPWEEHTSSLPNVFTGTTALYTVAGATFASHLMPPKVLKKLKKHVLGIQSRSDEVDKNQALHLNTKVAPLLAPIALAVAFGKLRDMNIGGDLVLFGILYVLAFVGMPPMDVPKTRLIASVFALALTVVANYIADSMASNPDQRLDGMGLCFTLVFCSTLIIASASELFFWDKKEKILRAKAYAVTAVVSSLVTTLVGWALALKCTALKDYTGHMLYDLSIPVTYLLVYGICKYF